MRFEDVGVGTFWASGSLSPMEQACLHTFVQARVPVTLFSYETIPNLPEGVVNESAAEIVAREYTERFFFNGQANLSHFSDIFRYEMIRQRGLIWIDVDVAVVGDFPELRHPNVLVTEEQGGVNGAVLFLEVGPLLDSIVTDTYALMGRELRWGETGPLLLTRKVETNSPIATYSHNVFYPVEHYDIWKVLLPEEADRCREQCDAATTLHLFNNILTTMGYWKSLAPPAGSYLAAVFEESGADTYFSGRYPDSVMRQVIENFRLRQSGKALGVKSVVREFVPSIGRTLRHYRKRRL